MSSSILYFSLIENLLSAIDIRHSSGKRGRGGHTKCQGCVEGVVFVKWADWRPISCVGRWAGKVGKVYYHTTNTKLMVTLRMLNSPQMILMDFGPNAAVEGGSPSPLLELRGCQESKWPPLRPEHQLPSLVAPRPFGWWLWMWLKKVIT